MNTVVISTYMDLKRHKWQWQCWKTSPTWDPVILPRPYPLLSILSMKCYASIYIFILSEDSIVEIWNSKLGQVVFTYEFSIIMKKIDFFDMYCQDLKFWEDITYWVIIVANKDGYISTCKCDTTKTINTSKIIMNSIENCFFRLINNFPTIILIGMEMMLLNVKDFSLINCLNIPGKDAISCSLILEDDAVLSRVERLYFFNNILSIQNLRIQGNTKDYHKLQVLELIDIDTNSMASISLDKIVIWKRPFFNMTRVFSLNGDVSGMTEKSLSCLVHNSRYLVIGVNIGLTIFDCISGTCVAEAHSVSDSQIIKIIHLEWLSMLLTISKESRLRFWAFQISDTNADLIKGSMSPFHSKSTSFSFSRQTSLKEQSQLYFLGKSFEKDKEKCQISCFLELESSIKSKNHIINLEEIGMLTSDGSSNLVLWRNREYALINLIQLLQL